MPEIGFFELCLIGIVMFLVLGPERMPEFFGMLGRAYRTATRWMAEVKEQWNAELLVDAERSEGRKEEGEGDRG